MSGASAVETAVAEILASPKYRTVAPALVRRLLVTALRSAAPGMFDAPGQDAPAHRMPSAGTYDQATDLTRRKLHQACGAFLTPNAGGRISRLLDAVDAGDPESLRATAHAVMALHASTRERLALMPDFYQRVLDEVPAPTSVLDLGCGLHPFAIPWMPLPPGCVYDAVDVTGTIATAVDRWLRLLGMAGSATVADIVEGGPRRHYDLVLLLKLLPTLEQQESGAAARLLDAVDGEWLVVSYPAHSLSGRGKGMAASYARDFASMAEARPWPVRRIDFPGELVFVVHKRGPAC